MLLLVDLNTMSYVQRRLIQSTTILTYIVHLHKIYLNTNVCTFTNKYKISSGVIPFTRSKSVE